MEPAGLALGAATIFSSCLECFNLLQLGRNYERDAESCQLRLDNVRWRLSEWGKNAKQCGLFSDGKQWPQSKRMNQICDVLVHTLKLLQDAEKKSQRYSKILIFPSSSSRYSTSVSSPLRLTTSRGISSGRGLRRRTSWALCDKKDLEDLLDNLDRFLGDLERLSHSEAYSRRRTIPSTQIYHDPTICSQVTVNCEAEKAVSTEIASGAPRYIVDQDEDQGDTIHTIEVDAEHGESEIF